MSIMKGTNNANVVEHVAYVCVNILGFDYSILNVVSIK